MKQITLRKVLGDVNPADLLTKHMTSRDKMEQLIKLFGLVAMKGRAKSAPLLRRKRIAEVGAEMDIEEDLDICVVKDLDEDGEVVTHEAGRHDIDIWPHLHSPEQIERLFPIATAVPENETIGAEVRDEHAALHRRWAGVRLSVVRG